MFFGKKFVSFLDAVMKLECRVNDLKMVEVCNVKECVKVECVYV